ncbi:YtxH domain-containing protein [Anthocerotibacter panamensis]|uniref:YtxH domain-containing protein n=1 Tax=Anthocerotibacter panamensis TaxID=2857077 RepID=UPI001C4062F0|nr:YtxH domain-containing protein [Anthocerotibacter panamensis]
MAGRNSSQAFWGGLFLGAALGTVCGILFAPRSGRETRRLLRNALDGLPNATEGRVDTFQVQANRILAQARGRVDETMSRLQEAIEAGKQASSEYRKHPESTNGQGPTTVSRE